MTRISFVLNTRVYINRSFRSSIGPSTRNASFAESCIFVKLAATNASASLHKHISTAMSIINGIARYGCSFEIRSISPGSIIILITEARIAPRIRNTVMSMKSWSAVEEIFAKRFINGFGLSASFSSSSSAIGRVEDRGAASGVSSFVPCLR